MKHGICTRIDGGNPINYVDPSGHKAKKKSKKITKQLEKIKEKVQI